MRKVWDFHGGIHPPENKTQSLQRELEDAPLPDHLILPLNMHIGAPARPIVEVGDKVHAGQMVAESAGGFSAAVHASTSGEIVAIEDRPIAHPSGLRAPCIVIATDGQDSWIDADPLSDFRQVEPARLVELLAQSGLAGMGGAGFPTTVKLQPRNPITTLIINGTECEPYITADHELMRSNAENIVRGAELLAYILGEPDEILIGIEDNKPDAIEIMIAAAENSRAEIVTFPTKYPSGGEKQLIEILTGKQVPSGGLPADLGIVMQNVGTAAAAWEAIVLGRPLTARVTTLVGNNLNTMGNFRVRIGTPVVELLKQVGTKSTELSRVIMGGPMMGFSLPDLNVPVTKITNCLIVPDLSELPEPPPAQPCIRCGNCAEACPASLLPQQLFWFAQSENTADLKAHNLFDCIECGACSYVCPSNIPLVQYYRASKGMIREAEWEKITSDRARERFEARQVRLAREVEERKAKREARAAAAKAKAAEKAAQESTEPKTATQSEVDTAGLERQLTTLRDRIGKMQAKAEAADSDDLRNKFLAQIKTTEAKISKLEKQLTQNSTNSSAGKPAEANTDTDALEHQLTTLRERIGKLQDKADAADNEDIRNKFLAQIKTTEAKISKLEEQLGAVAGEN